MFASKAWQWFAVAIFAYTGMALGSWEPVPNSPGGGNKWSKVECESGNGWQPCVKASTPILVCRYDSSNKYIVRGGTCRGSSNYPVNCTRWATGVRTLWDGQCNAGRPGYSAGSIKRVIRNIACGQGEVVQDTEYEICRLE